MVIFSLNVSSLQNLTMNNQFCKLYILHLPIWYVWFPCFSGLLSRLTLNVLFLLRITFFFLLLIFNYQLRILITSIKGKIVKIYKNTNTWYYIYVFDSARHRHFYVGTINQSSLLFNLWKVWQEKWCLATLLTLSRLGVLINDKGRGVFKNWITLTNFRRFFAPLNNFVCLYFLSS